MLQRVITETLPARNNGETYYDLFEDWELIESSFLKQYGIRLRNEDDMSWSEFCSLLSGIMPDTPLGQIVSIRAEKDPKVLKHFTKEQKRIRSEWQRRKYEKLKENPEAYENYWREMQEAFKRMFS